MGAQLTPSSALRTPWGLREPVGYWGLNPGQLCVVGQAPYPLWSVFVFELPVPELGLTLSERQVLNYIPGLYFGGKDRVECHLPSSAHGVLGVLEGTWYTVN